MRGVMAIIKQFLIKIRALFGNNSTIKNVKIMTQQISKDKYYSDAYGWMDVLDTISDGTITVIECRTWNNEVVCVALPKENNFQSKQKSQTL